mgnify:CR=1 FL=1
MLTHFAASSSKRVIQVSPKANLSIHTLAARVGYPRVRLPAQRNVQFRVYLAPFTRWRTPNINLRNLPYRFSPTGIDTFSRLGKAGFSTTEHYPLTKCPMRWALSVSTEDGGPATLTADLNEARDVHLEQCTTTSPVNLAKRMSSVKSTNFRVLVHDRRTRITPLSGRGMGEWRLKLGAADAHEGGKEGPREIRNAYAQRRSNRPTERTRRRGQHGEGEVYELGCAVERGPVILQAGLAIDLIKLKYSAAKELTLGFGHCVPIE